MSLLIFLSGLPPNVNSMQVPPNAPRGMSSAQVMCIKQLNINATDFVMKHYIQHSLKFKIFKKLWA